MHGWMIHSLFVIDGRIDDRCRPRWRQRLKRVIGRLGSQGARGAGGGRPVVWFRTRRGIYRGEILLLGGQLSGKPGVGLFCGLLPPNFLHELLLFLHKYFAFVGVHGVQNGLVNLKTMKALLHKRFVKALLHQRFGSRWCSSSTFGGGWRCVRRWGPWGVRGCHFDIVLSNFFKQLFLFSQKRVLIHGVQNGIVNL